MKRLTKLNRTLAEDALVSAQVAQTEFWTALRELELALDCEVDGNLDLDNETVDSLRKETK